jgi:hypothetical protein
MLRIAQAKDLCPLVSRGAFRCQALLRGNGRNQAREWLTLQMDESGSIESRATAIETAVRDQLQIVVIDLAPDENAQRDPKCPRCSADGR